MLAAEAGRLPAWLSQGLVCALLLGSTAIADPVATGAVSFDAATGIYTYSYSLDNAGGPGNISEFMVQVNSWPYSSFFPLNDASPAGWSFSVGYTAGGSCPEFGECGGFWAWTTPDSAPNGLPAGESLSGFSFQTSVSPSGSTANDYFLFYPYDPNYAAFGNVVAPDYLVPRPPPPPPAPEPSSLLLFVAGLMGLGVSGAFNRALFQQPKSRFFASLRMTALERFSTTCPKA